MTGLLFSKRAVASILTYTLFCAFFLTTWSRYSYGGYSATIQEGRAGAEEMLKKRGASSISIAFVADGRVVWTQAFGLADKKAETPATTATMYGIGSTSKMIATIATMILVDRGDIDLDMPLVTHVPDFRMLSPEYPDVTMRMLLNHGSGFPGSDMRNSLTASPYSGYAKQLLADLSQERLSHPPGYMNIYCNDGFSMIENLISSVTGKSYVQFVRDEILTPLGMLHSHYTLKAFPPGSYAHTCSGDVANPQAFVNMYASGGLYSTPSDMAKVILMILNDGKHGGNRILSESAIKAMATDQTAGTFDPVQEDRKRLGLGWDTVSQPGLKAVGVKAWAISGDAPHYGSELIVLPDQKMGVMVSGASHFDSGDAAVIAERILLRALIEKGVINDFPAPLPEDPKPLLTPTLRDLSAITGYFAKNGSLLHIDVEQDDSLAMLLYTGSEWLPYLNHLKMREDGMFSSDEAPLREFGTISADGRTYLVLRDAYGNRHYQDDTLFMRKIAGAGPLSPAWNIRLEKVWLLVNGNAGSLLPSNTEPGLAFPEPDGLQGLVAVSTYDDSSFSIVDPSQSDDLGAMMLFMQDGGRDLNDSFIVPHGGEEWVRFGSLLYRPKDGAPVLSTAGETIVIGDEGYAEWRTVLIDSGAMKVTVESNGVWKLFDPEVRWISTRQGSGSVTLPEAIGSCFLMFRGSPGESIEVTFAPVSFKPPPPAGSQELPYYLKLRKAVRELPVSLRAPFMMRFFRKMSYAEIASLLGISNREARKRVHLARAMLRRTLGPFQGGRCSTCHILHSE